ncbi:MAG TPA: S1 RNA-binding domain-containing protein, partial [Chryseolinea sp.]|nr:S1 RNA-binding domain-containing protein [Chryseolinea sp.]
MAKAQKPVEKTKRSDDSEESSGPVKKVKTTVEIDLDEEDPLAEVKSAQKEAIDTEAIPVSELRKAKYAQQVAGEFDFDAFASKGFGEGYSKEKMAELNQLYSGTVATVNTGEVVSGTVVGINDRDVILNIGFKSDGLVPLAEFKDMVNLKIGDVVDLFIEEREDAMGQLSLSRRKAKLVKGWEYVQTALDKDTIIEGFVKRRTKGGLIVDVFGIEAFLPGSQIDVKPIRDFDIYVNKSIEVKVVKINYTNDNVVVSHKVLIEKDLEQQKVAILSNLEKGQVLEGTIKNMTNFGVFIDLGGVDGLLHITDISWGRI